MFKSCCPFNRIDWNESGGLCNCNWPCCCPDDLSDRDTRYLVITQEPEHLLIELDGTTSIPPLCLLCWFSLIPIILVAVVAMIPSGHIQAVAWQFDIENGHLLLRERVKHVCSESLVLKLSSVRSVLVETYTEREPSNGCRVMRGRLRLIGIGPNGDESSLIVVNAPKKLIVDHSLDLLHDTIIQMIPPRLVFQLGFF